MNKDNYKKFIRIGKELYESEQYEESIRNYNNAINIDKNLESAWIWKGRSLSKLRKFDEALDCNDRALAKNPKSVNGWKQRAEIFSNMNKYQDVIDCCDKVVEFSRFRKLGRKEFNLKSLALKKLGEAGKSLECALEGLKIFPVSFLLLARAGEACEALKKYDDAINFLNKAIRIKPRNWEVWYNKGVNLNNLWKESGRKESELLFESVECYLRATYFNPNCARCWNNLGAITLNSSETNESLLLAIEYFDKAVTADPRYWRAMDGKSYALKKLGRDAESKECSRLADKMSGKI